jgi:hypothetical protein
MSVVYDTTTIKTPRMQIVADIIDSLTVSASTGSHLAGKLVIQTSGAATLVTIPFNTTCGTVSGAVLTFSVSPSPLSGVATGTGTAAIAVIQNNASANRITGLTVGTSGSDINLNSTSITISQTVTITSGTITHG